MNKIRLYASEYEPALVASIVAAVFTLLAGLGIAVGGYSGMVNAVLTFVAFIAPIVAGGYTRRKVSPVAATGNH